MKTFALAGNPNSGKTTLFNALTGATAYVGNWPGVTVEKREGKYKGKHNGVEAKIVDLPGIYSLSPYTPEEIISRNFILDEKPDLVINVVDATNLERNLYLTTQLLEIDVPVVVALNMNDLLQKQGISVDVPALEKTLGVPVVLVSALRTHGIDELLAKADKASNVARKGTSVLSNTAHAELVGKATKIMEENGIASPVFHAVKMLECDELEEKSHPEEAKKIHAILPEDMEFDAISADERYQYISEKCSIHRKGEKIERAKDKLTVSDKIDRVLTNRWAGIPIFLLILLIVFGLTFSEDLLFLHRWFGVQFSINFEGSYFEGLFWTDGGINSPGVILSNLWGGFSGWLADLINQGLANVNTAPWAVGFINSVVVDGVFAVIGFLPQILVLYIFFSILEDSGYMARVAFIFDRIFRRLGLSGRAFIPMLMGYGCGVPAMVNTRTLNTDKEKTQTIRAIAFFPCGAKMTLLAAIAGVLAGNFHQNATLFSYGVYVGGLVIAILAVILMHWTTQREKVPPFIMELPAYHLPQFRALMIHIWDKVKHYLKKVSTIVIVSAIFIWAFTHLTWNWTYIEPEEVINMTYNGVALAPELWADVADAVANENFAALAELIPGYVEGTEGDILITLRGYEGTVLHGISSFVSPIFVPMGFGNVQTGQYAWAYTLSSVTGIVAKEVVPDTLIIVSSGDLAGFVTASGITVGGFYAFVMFNLMTIPCFAAISTAKAELPKGKLKWTLLFWICASYLIGVFVYLSIDFVWTLAISLPILVGIYVAAYFYNRNKTKKEEALAA
ncbi:MAG: ferrous iron transporter B [Bacilli bacterium]|nr:ferrous iron transporter B [Bacilli bacterium]